MTSFQSHDQWLHSQAQHQFDDDGENQPSLPLNWSRDMTKTLAQVDELNKARAEVKDKVRSIVKSNLDESALSLIGKDLDNMELCLTFDSLEKIHLVISLEEAFKIDIPAEIYGCDNICLISDYIKTLLDQGVKKDD